MAEEISPIVPSSMIEEQWLYADVTSQEPRGPVPTSVLKRLLERSLAGVTPSTLVWKTDLEDWTPLSNIPEFAEECWLLSSQWYYVDTLAETSSKGETSTTRGPISSRLLLHKLSNGELDGLTLVFCATTREGSTSEENWKPVNEIIELRRALQKQVAVEEARDEVMNRLSHEEKENGEIQEAETIDTWLTKTDENENNLQNHLDDIPTENPRKRSSTDIKDEESCSESEEETKISKDNEKISKSRRKKKRPMTWIYISGLPKDVTEEEVCSHFSKMGMIALSPIDQSPRIKLYRHDDGTCKGDALLCYHSATSAKMACDILDGGYLRLSACLSVTPAKFNESSSSSHDHSTKKSSNHGNAAAAKVARDAARLAMSWQEGDDPCGSTGSSNLRIVVLEGLFSPEQLESAGDEAVEELERTVGSECERCGVIEKLTMFARHPRGIMLARFATAFGAAECIRMMNGRHFSGRRVKAYFWDGVTNYAMEAALTVTTENGLSGLEAIAAVEEEDEARRLDAFGDWLDKEQEELPEEFRLRTE